MKLLEITRNPKIYAFVQLFAGGKEKNFTIIRDHMNLKQGETVLDVGCGTGEAAQYFGDAYYGTDPSDEYLEFARAKHGDKFKKLSNDRLDYPDASFNYVFTANVFHHVSDETANKLMSEMKRVCKPDGRIYIADPIWPAKWNIIGTAIFALDLGKYQRRAEQLIALVQAHGFQILTKKIPGTFPHHYMIFTFQK